MLRASLSGLLFVPLKLPSFLRLSDLSRTILRLHLRHLRSHPAPPHVAPRQWQLQEAAAQLSLLQLLPAMALDASVAPLAARALAPLQSEGAPLLLRCLALRLTVQGWLLTGALRYSLNTRQRRLIVAYKTILRYKTASARAWCSSACRASNAGRGWARVEAAINGYAPQDRAALPPLQLRVTRASLIRLVPRRLPCPSADTSTCLLRAGFLIMCTQ